MNVFRIICVLHEREMWNVSTELQSENVKGKNCLGRPQVRWEVDTKTVLKEVGCGFDSCGAMFDQPL